MEEAADWAAELYRGSLLARKFSLFWRLGNFVLNQLNVLPKSGRPQSSNPLSGSQRPATRTYWFPTEDLSILGARSRRCDQPFGQYFAELNGQLVRVRAMTENVDHGDEKAVVVPLYQCGVP
jgi:hypothetical protein